MGTAQKRSVERRHAAQHNMKLRSTSASLLPSGAAGQRKHHLPRTFLCFLLLCLFGLLPAATNVQARDVDDDFEILGNPLLTRYPGQTNAWARQIRTLQPSNNRLYMNHGTMNTGGPMDVWYFDFATDTMVKEAMLPEEVINRYRIIDGSLYAPGYDSMSAGAIYRWELNKGWMMYPCGPDGHYYDIMKQGDSMVVLAGPKVFGYPGVAVATGLATNTALKFLPPGQTTQTNPYPFYSVNTEFFQFNSDIYEAVVTSNTTDPTLQPYIFKYTGNASSPAQPVHLLYSNFFKGGEIFASIKDFRQVSTNLAYFLTYQKLYSITNVDTGNPTLVNLPGQPASTGPNDYGYIRTLQQFGNTLYAMSVLGRVSNQYPVVVCRSTNGLTWDEYFRVRLPSPAATLAEGPDGSIYMGMDYDGTSPWQNCGTLVRVRPQAIASTTDLPRPMVTLFIERSNVWENAQQPISFTLRRSGTVTNSLTVFYSVAGTAVPDFNYTALTGSVTFDTNSYTADITISPIQQASYDGDTTVSVSIAPSSTYSTVGASSATVRILDATPAFSNISPSGMLLWLKADAGVTLQTDGTVSAWKDVSSGSNRTLSQTTAASRPRYLTNGLASRPALQFDGINDWLDLGSMADQVYYAAIVFTNAAAVTPNASGQTLINIAQYLEGGSRGIDMGYAQTYFNDATLSIYMQGLRGTNYTLPAAPHLLALRQPNLAQPYSWRIDGAVKTPSIIDTRRFVTLYANDFRIGSRSGTDRFFKGNISEIILYNRPVSDAEASAVETYLNQKYFQANRNPVAQNDAFIMTSTSTSALIGLAKVLGNDYDLDGDSLSLASYSATTANGGTVSLVGSDFLYTRNPANTNTDRFVYTVTDRRGGTSSANITITADFNLFNAQTDNLIGTQVQPGGVLRLHFIGIPGRTFSVQASPSLSTPAWTTLGQLVAGLDGTFQFDDAQAAQQTTRFYRAVTQ